MNRLVSHIEFLLHDHNCVIIPEFGGFVVNAIHSCVENGGALHAPSCELVFNRDLTYNDGLLAQSYMKTYQLTFETATLEIQKGVRDLKHRLYDHRHLEMGQLGSFVMHDDKRIVYAPASFTRPAFFGLSKTTLKPLALMPPTEVARTKVVPLNPVKPPEVNPEVNLETNTKRKRIASISAAAVAVIAIMLLLFPASDSTVGRQSARMLSETEWFRAKPSPITHPDVLADQTQIETITEEAVPTAGIAHESVMPNDLAVADGAGTELPQNGEMIKTTAASMVDEVLPKYYIIMGVFTRTQTAQKMTDELTGKGFTQTGWLERSGRIDVYAASFTDEAAAKIYLKEIHGQYPAYSDAWVLKR